MGLVEPGSSKAGVDFEVDFGVDFGVDLEVDFGVVFEVDFGIDLESTHAPGCSGSRSGLRSTDPRMLDLGGCE